MKKSKMTYEQAVATAMLRAIWLNRPLLTPPDNSDLTVRTHALRRLRVRAGLTP